MAEKYPGAKWWDAPDDGAPFRCASCGELGHHSVMVFTETPNGNRSVDHKDCIDPEWLDRAEYMGVYKFPGGR